MLCPHILYILTPTHTLHTLWVWYFPNGKAHWEKNIVKLASTPSNYFPLSAQMCQSLFNMEWTPKICMDVDDWLRFSPSTPLSPFWNQPSTFTFLKSSKVQWIGEEINNLIKEGLNFSTFSRAGYKCLWTIIQMYKNDCMHVALHLEDGDQMLWDGFCEATALD